MRSSTQRKLETINKGRKILLESVIGSSKDKYHLLQADSRQLINSTQGSLRQLADKEIRTVFQVVCLEYNQCPITEDDIIPADALEDITDADVSEGDIKCLFTDIQQNQVNRSMMNL